MPVAYIDESERSGPSGTRYILGATIPFSNSACAEYREQMISLLPRNQPKVHWYRAIERHKEEIVSAIESFDVVHYVAIHDRRLGESSERARRSCIGLLTFELEKFDVQFAIFESRTERLDVADLKMLNYLRSSKAISSPFRGKHVAGATEPMLWIADAVCGVVGDEVAGNSIWSTRLESQIHRVFTRAAR